MIGKDLGTEYKVDTNTINADSVRKENVKFQQEFCGFIHLHFPLLYLLIWK